MDRTKKNAALEKASQEAGERIVQQHGRDIVASKKRLDKASQIIGELLKTVDKIETILEGLQNGKIEN